ncbi:MAG: MAPEG family protein [Pseudomonadales bacterium]|nr:MAPEG family protein [Pseudomonadales bacterium]MDG1441471.1 MAPEG family protein [Pseudomonadales bacterium]
MSMLSLSASPILLPIIALVLWTLIMQGWMLLARIPAMTSLKIDISEAERTADLAAKLPKQVMWKADNYNHLMEQPTIFYAAALALALAGLGTDLNVILAWVYVGSRVVHSIVHSTTNNVPIRFGLFVIGTLTLLVMAVNGAVALMG